MEIPLCRKLRWSSGFHQQPEPLLLWVKHLVFLFFGEKIFFFYSLNTRLWLIWKLIAYIQVCILHDCDNVYSGLWRYLSHDQDWKVSILKYWGTHLWLIVIVTHNFRMFQIMFLVVGLAMFTTVIPEAMVLVRSFSRCINARYVFLVKNQIRSW